MDPIQQPITPPQDVPPQPQDPQPVATVKFAGFWIRFVAYFIDGIIVGVANFIVGIFLGIAFSSQMNASDPATSLLFSGLGLIVSFIIPCIYSIWMIHAKQATIGKMAVGIIVLSETGAPLSLGKIILRETIGKIVSGILLLIGYIMAGFTERKQALHDKMASSVVVYKDSSKHASTAIVVVVVVIGALVGLVIIGILSAVVLASLGTARAKGNDAAVQATISSASIESLIYADKNLSFAGFKSSGMLPDCGGSLITNIAEGGQTIALFGKSCSEENTFYCKALNVDSKELGSVTKISATSIPSDKIDCN